MEFNKLIVIDPQDLSELARKIVSDVKQMIADERKANEGYLSTRELSDVFPYSAEWFRDQINKKKFGRKAGNGDCMAKYSEVEKYLFNNTK